MYLPRLRPKRTVIIAGAVTLLLAAGTAVAIAAVAGSPVDSSGVIHGCYTTTAINGSHVFKLQDAGTKCPKGTTAISWNQSGPGYEIYPVYWPGLEQDVAPGQTVTVTANCTAVPGKTGYVTGGGVVTYNGPAASNPPLHAADLRVIDSYPYPGSAAPDYNTGWTVTMVNESSSQTESFQTWAMCMYPTQN